MGRNLTSPNAGFCTLDGGTPGTNQERSDWRAALQKGFWGCWWTLSSA